MSVNFVYETQCMPVAKLGQPYRVLVYDRVIIIIIILFAQ